MRNAIIAIVFVIALAVAAGLGWLAWQNMAPDAANLPAEEIAVEDLASGGGVAEDEDAATDSSADGAAVTDTDAGDSGDSGAAGADAAAAPLRFVYQWNGRLTLWQDGAEQNLGAADATHAPALSPDGELVAFVRDGGLWVMNTQGEQERMLVSAGEIEGMGRDDATAGLHRFAWLPGTRRLLFNTALNLQTGIALTNDLYLVDAESLELTELLAAGTGGEFHIAPDGETIAVVSPDRIRVVNPLGVAQRPDFTFTPLMTYSSFAYYAQPVWAADSSSLAVVIPHPQAVMQPEQPAVIYRLAAHADETQSLGEIQAARPSYWIDPTLQYVAYPHSDPESAGASATGEPVEEGAAQGGAPGVSMRVARLDGSEATTYYEGDGLFLGWSPTGEHFTLATPGGEESIQVGSLSDTTLTPLAGLSHAFSHQVWWVDEARFVVMVADSAQTTVALASVNDAANGDMETLMQMEAGNFMLDLATE